MSDNRFFLDCPFVKNEEKVLSSEELHHIKVLRKKEQDSIEIINGQGQFAHATIIKLEKKHCLIRLDSVETKIKKRKITLCIALFESNRIEWVVEKATELDVDAICFYAASRSKKSTLSEHEKTRLEKHAIASMKQCDRWDLPKLAFFSSLETIPFKGPLYFGDIHAKKFPTLDSEKDCMIVIGPPSGFTQKEEEVLLSNQAIGISLSKNILRAETAAIVAVAFIAK